MNSLKAIISHFLGNWDLSIIFTYHASRGLLQTLLLSHRFVISIYKHACNVCSVNE